MKVETCNPLLRTPLSLIIDDSCPVINLGWYYTRQWLAWKAKHQPSAPPERWQADPRKLDAMPRTIPADFARKWGEWCGEAGVKGKFSMIPFPAGAGRVDRDFPDFPQRDLEDWLRVAKETIRPNFDLTPEMLTHTHVVDLKTWQFTEEWEQREWVDPPVEPLTDYIATAMQLLANAGIPCEGVTSPGAFGKKKEEAYSRATLDAALRVNKDPRPFYFLWVKANELPSVPIWHADKEKGIAIASIVACTGDWFGGWTGFDAGNADLFIAEDLRGGRLPPILEKELPCVLVGHWPGFYFGGDEFGLRVLKEAKRRLDLYDPDGSRTLWMKNSEIGHYWMARELSDITVEPASGGATGGSGVSIRISTRFPTSNFTLSLDTSAKRVRFAGADLRSVTSRRDFRSGTFLVDGERTCVAFDLPMGGGALTVVAS